MQCAWAASRKKASDLQAQFQRLRHRRGPKKAICAVAASILTTAYHMLRDGTFYQDLGADYFRSTSSETQANRLARQIAKLGFTCTLTPQPEVMFLFSVQDYRQARNNFRASQDCQNVTLLAFACTAGQVMSRNHAAPVPALDHVELRLRQQELAARFGLFALGQDELQPVLDEACRVAAEGLGVQHAKLLRREAQHGDFLTVAGVGWRLGVVGVCRLGPGRESPAGFCIEVGEAVVSGRLEEERRFVVPPVLTEHCIHSAINVPVPVPAGGPACFWGVLEADGTGRDRFAQPDSAFLLLLAATLGACVEREARRTELRRLIEGRDAERDLLVQEVHHRVKNSLQLVTALLTTQARGADVPTVREQLLEAAGRVATIGAVHERLYRDRSGEEADAGVYLAGLVEDLRRSMSDAAAGRTVTLDVPPPPLRLPADRLTPLGLIATELVTNALKYGEGRVRLVVRPIQVGIEVACEDEGLGFPKVFDPRRSRGLGMRLVTALAKGTDPVRVDRSVPHSRLVVTVTQA